MLTQISLMAKSPQCSMMPRLCLGKLLQFPTTVTCSKIRLFAATAWQSTFSYSGHTVIMNGAFHLQIQKCRAEEASLSPVAGGGRGERQGEEHMGKRGSPGQGVDGAPIPQVLLLHLFLSAAHLIQQERLSYCALSVKMQKSSNW